MKAFPDAPPLEVYLLGLIDLEDVLLLQRRIVYELGEGGGASLILCEHPPTISVGRSGSRAHIVPDDEGLRGLGIQVRWVSRGGGCLLHLPGQLAAYLIIPLQDRGLTLCTYIDRLYEAVVGVLEEFDLRGVTRPELPGVFLGSSRVASVAVAVSRWIAYHGITLNVGPFLSLLDLLEEPGSGSALLRQTSMESRRQRCIPMSRVRETLVRHLARVLGLERHHVYTGHPLIRRKVLSHVYAPTP
jgi:lipoyl(octanoyl) transferase